MLILVANLGSTSFKFKLLDMGKNGDEVARGGYERIGQQGSAHADHAAVIDVILKQLERKPDANLPKGFDVTAVEDPKAEPLWARFYEIETNRPFFCGRDGVKKWSLDQIDRERRVGYAWLRPWGVRVLKEYERWSKKHGDSHAGVR